jgi:hypothetical protein
MVISTDNMDMSNTQVQAQKGQRWSTGLPSIASDNVLDE